VRRERRTRKEKETRDADLAVYVTATISVDRGKYKAV